MTKKAQVQITETIAVLFIFFVLVAFGIIFYYRYQQGALLEEQHELQSARAMDTTLRVLFMPELMCTKGTFEYEDNCIDLPKMRALQKSEFFVVNQAYYYNLFSTSQITVHTLYPGELRSDILYENNAGGFSNYEPTYFVVALRDVDAQGNSFYSFGYLEVGVYS